LLLQGAAGATAAPKSFVPPAAVELQALFPQLEILGLIGTGGMGAVYKARQRELDRLVALKILPPDIGEVPGFAERFSREAKALARLNHPGIVTIHDTGRAAGLYFLIMEFMDGPNLRQLLEARRVDPGEAVAIVLVICDALRYAHESGIVHRDIKPENILIDRQGRVKVADFGLAKLVGWEEKDADESSEAAFGVTEAGHLMGTPQYMAPEQILEPFGVDHRVDIYSLGVVFYQLLTGELPDRVVVPPSHKAPVDARLDEVVLRALEKDPRRRFPHIAEFKEAVEAIALVATRDPGEGNANGEIKFTCPNCEQKLSVGEAEAGTEAICPRCAQPLVVPTPPLIYQSVNPFARKQSGHSEAVRPGPARAVAIWSLVLGLIGLVPVLGLATGGIGLLLGIIAWVKGTSRKGFAITGMVAGAISLLATPMHLGFLSRNDLDKDSHGRSPAGQQFKTESRGVPSPADAAPRSRPQVTERPQKSPPAPVVPRLKPPRPPPPAMTVELALVNLPKTAPRDQRPLLRFLAEAAATPEQRPMVIAALKPLLNDMENGEAAFQAFVNWAGKEQVPELIEILRVAPASARGKQCMQMLSRMGDARAAEPLAALLSEFPIARDAKAALASLGDIAKPVVLPMFHHEDGDVREAARELLRGYKTTDEEILAESIRALGMEGKERKRSALSYLGAAKLTPENKVAVAKAARPLLNDPEERVRDAAREAMKFLATKADADFLLTLMVSTDEPTRAFATDLLVQFKDARAAKPLAMLLSDAHKTYWAGDKLIQLGSATEPAIIPYLASDDPGTRQRAADILARIGTPASLRALSVVAEKDKNFFTKVAATNAINAIKGRASGNKR
jgi:serine/threonine protein kinase/HEAT repeat protein